MEDADAKSSSVALDSANRVIAKLDDIYRGGHLGGTAIRGGTCNDHLDQADLNCTFGARNRCIACQVHETLFESCGIRQLPTYSFHGSLHALVTPFISRLKTLPLRSQPVQQEAMPLS